MMGHTYIIVLLITWRKKNGGMRGSHLEMGMLGIGFQSNKNRVY